MAMRSSRSPCSSKSDSSMRVACCENTAKFTPPPSKVAPSGYSLPGRSVRAKSDDATTEKVGSARRVAYEPRDASEAGVDARVGLEVLDGLGQPVRPVRVADGARRVDAGPLAEELPHQRER